MYESNYSYEDSLEEKEYLDSISNNSLNHVAHQPFGVKEYKTNSHLKRKKDLKPVRIKENSYYSKMDILSTDGKDSNRIEKQSSKSLLDKFHKDFISSLESFKDVKPLNNNSSLYYDHVMKEKEAFLREQEKNKNIHQKKARKRLKVANEKKERVWRNWIEKQANIKITENSNSSKRVPLGTNTNQISRDKSLRSAPIVNTSKRYNEHKPNTSASVGLNNKSSNKSDKVIESLSVRKERAMATWCNSLMSKIRDTYIGDDEDDPSDDEDDVIEPLED